LKISIANKTMFVAWLRTARVYRE